MVRDINRVKVKQDQAKKRAYQTQLSVFDMPAIEFDGQSGDRLRITA